MQRRTALCGLDQRHRIDRPDQAAGLAFFVFLLLAPDF
jgi:hypothetical protein